MKQETIYISGKITGEDPREVEVRFAAAEGAIEKMGHKAVNPLKNGLSPTEPWHEHMRRDIRALTRCTAIFLIPGWEQSKGARLEYEIARQLGMRTITTEKNNKTY